MIIGMKTLFILLFILFSSTAHTATAQINGQLPLVPDLQLEAEPPFPRPGDGVTITVNDSRGGTYGSNITWLYNGEVFEGTENQRSIEITAGALNEEIEIDAILSKPSRESETLSLTVKSIYLDIVVEAQTRVPDFYMGRALPSIGSMINATALVNDGSNRTDLVYTWRLDRTVIEGGPIRRRNQVTFVAPRGGESILSVVVTEPDGTILAERLIPLPSVLPNISFHEVSTLFGVKKNPIGDELILVGNTATVQAEPYNLDIRVYNNPDIAQWEINNSLSQNQGGNPYQITFQTTGFEGPANLSFQVRDTTRVLQGARDTIQVRF